MGTKKEQRLLPPARIVEILNAITRHGPLPYSDLKYRILGPISEERLREIVVMGSDRQVFRTRTRDKDLPEELWKGRANRTQYVEITKEGGYVVGINIGRTYIAVGVADANGLLVSKYGDRPSRDLSDRKREEAWKEFTGEQIEVVKRSPGVIGRAVLRRAAKETKKRLKDLGISPERVRGITLSVPAPTSVTESKLLTHSIENRLASVGNIETNFKSMLGGKSVFPRLEKVVLANDADVAVRGEVGFGKGHGKKDVLVVHAAYGIGAGIVTDAKVLRTGAGGGVGEIGHCVPTIGRDEGSAHGLVPLDPNSETFTCECEAENHLEGLAGGQSIIKRLAASVGNFSTDPPEKLAERLEDPERNVAETLDLLLEAISGADGSEVWRPGLEAVLDAANMIGRAVHTLVHLFRPETVYLCGKLSEAGDSFLTEVEAGFEATPALDNYTPPIELGRARSEVQRRLIMVRGAAMTAVRATWPLITLEDLESLEFG